MKNTFLFLIILTLSNLSFSTELNCKKFLNEQEVNISVEGDISNLDAALLANQAQQLLKSVSKNLKIPQNIFFGINEQGPVYDQGLISARYPFFVDYNSGNEQTRLTKSARASLAINLHELTHQIFETNIMNAYKQVEPEVVWAFFTRVDMRGEGMTRELIEETKSASRYKDKSVDEIMEHFFEFASTAEVYNEFLADTLPVLFFRNPDAIYNSVHFEKVEKDGDQFDQEFQRSHRFRRFAVKHTLDEIKKIEYPDSYTILSPTKNFLWEKVGAQIQSLPKGHEQVGVIAEKVIKAAVASFKEVTVNFTSTNRIPIEEMNANFQKHLERELAH